MASLGALFPASDFPSPFPPPPPLSGFRGLLSFEPASFEVFVEGFGVLGLLPPFFFFLLDLDLPLEVVGEMGVGSDF